MLRKATAKYTDLLHISLEVPISAYLSCNFLQAYARRLSLITSGNTPDTKLFDSLSAASVAWFDRLTFAKTGVFGCVVRLLSETCVHSSPPNFLPSLI